MCSVTHYVSLAACRSMNESIEKYGIYEWPETLAGDKASIACYHESLSISAEVHAWKHCIASNKWTVTDIRECPKVRLLITVRFLLVFFFFFWGGGLFVCCCCLFVLCVLLLLFCFFKVTSYDFSLYFVML